MQQQETTISSRLLRFLSAGPGVGALDLLAKAVGESFYADAVCVQVLSPDRGLIPIAWYGRSPRLRDAVERAVREGALDRAARAPAKLNVCEPLRKGDAQTQVGAYFESLPADAWIERVGVTGADHALAGVLTVIGTSSEGCPSLSDDERAILANTCCLALAAATQARRSDRLEEQLAFLVGISRSLGSRKTIVERLKGAVAAAQRTTGFDSIQLLTWDPTGHKLLLNVLYIQGTGFTPDDTWDRMTREEIEASSRRFLEDPTPMILSDPANLPDIPPQHRNWMIANNVRFLVFVPLVFEGEHLGTVVLTSHFSRERTEERIRILTALGSHLASILRLSLLLAQVEEAYQRLSYSHRRTIETLALAAEMRDATTGRHLKQLKTLGVALGKKLGFSAEDLETLTYGAVVHDIGKLHVPDAVLLKPGKLSESEQKIMRTHPESGEKILIQSDVPEPVRKIVRWHHERWDGSGYPDGLAGDSIPLAVQIITVADAFDALTSVRPYKEAWSLARTLAEIKRNRGTQFAPNAVDALLEVIPTVWKSERTGSTKAA